MWVYIFTGRSHPQFDPAFEACYTPRNCIPYCAHRKHLKHRLDRHKHFRIRAEWLRLFQLHSQLKSLSDYVQRNWDSIYVDCRRNFPKNICFWFQTYTNDLNSPAIYMSSLAAIPTHHLHIASGLRLCSKIHDGITSLLVKINTKVYQIGIT